MLKKKECRYYTRQWRTDTWDVAYCPERDRDMAVYYVDLCPCDNMADYADVLFMPEFVKEDNAYFDDNKNAYSVVQVATRFGWAIMAKWFNNGSTRLYGRTPNVVMDAVSIVHGRCDIGDCAPAFGEYIVNYKLISEDDKKVFFGKYGW